MGKLLRGRDLGLLFVGALVSYTGDFVLFVALPFWIYRLTGSTVATGAMFAATVLPQLVLSPIAGVFVDRWQRKATMIVSDLVRAGVVLTLLLVRTADQAWLIYVVAIAESSVSRFFIPARTAMAPQVVPRQDLRQANALMGLTEALARLGGPALGGMLVARVGPHGAALFDAVSYLISAAAITGIRVPAHRSERPAAGGWRTGMGAAARELGEGVRVVGRRPLLRLVFAVASVFMLSQGIITVLLVVTVSDVWHAGASELGWLLSAQGVGALIGGVAIGSVSRRIGTRTMMAAGGIGCGALLGVMVNQPAITVAYLLIAPAGMLVVGMLVGLQTLLQVGSDDANLGRVASLLGAANAAAMLLSMGLTSALADRVGVAPLLTVAAGAIILSGLIALASPAMPREGPRLTGEPAA